MQPPSHIAASRQNRIRTAALIGALLCCAPVLCAATTPTPVTYAVQDLGVLPGDATSGAWGINARGDVVGWSTSADGPRAFLFTDADGLVELPALPGRDWSFARDINNLGVIVGTASSGKEDAGSAVLWMNGGVTDLGTIEGAVSSDAWAINDKGRIVGSSTFEEGQTHAFLYEVDRGMVDLTPDNKLAAALDVNEAGHITGYFATPSGPLHAFLSTSEKVIDLGVPYGFTHSSGAAVNASGAVAGTASGSGKAHVFRVEGAGKLVDLNGKRPIAYALGMNAFGQIVGYTGGRSKRAFVYSEKFGFQDLNTLIPPLVGWVFEAATDINDNGEIVGYGYNTYTNEMRAVRLRPQAPDLAD
jgi:probable HAF family extracellular repeat protein